jgi:hypothetical protein
MESAVKYPVFLGSAESVISLSFVQARPPSLQYLKPFVLIRPVIV